VCNNTHGSYACICNDGFTADTHTTCVDVDECAVGDKCDYGQCKNDIGGFICECQDGFEYHSGSDHCVDIDECITDQDDCGEHFDCINNVGSFECDCIDDYGFHPTTQKCQPMLKWHGETSLANWYARGGHQPLLGQSDRNYESMFDDDIETYWLGFLDSNFIPMEHNCVVVEFKTKILYHSLQIVTRPDSMQYFGGTYQKLCLYLDGNETTCTPEDLVVDVSEIISFSVEPIEAQKIELRFQSTVPAQVADFVIVYDNIVNTITHTATPVHTTITTTTTTVVVTTTTTLALPDNLLTWHGESGPASWYALGGNHPLVGQYDRNYESMFDEDIETYWLGYLDSDNTPLEHNCVVIEFTNSIMFYDLQILTRPNGKQYFGGTYQNLCLYLDDVQQKCTSSNYDADVGSIISFRLDGIESVKIELRFDSTVPAQVADLKIFYRFPTIVDPIRVVFGSFTAVGLVENQSSLSTMIIDAYNNEFDHIKAQTAPLEFGSIGTLGETIAITPNITFLVSHTSPSALDDINAATTKIVNSNTNVFSSSGPIIIDFLESLGCREVGYNINGDTCGGN